MNRAIVLAESARAKQSLRAAEILAREECAEDAISRAYYATLHAAKAALLIHEVVVESHAAVKRMSYPLGCRLGRSFAEGPATGMISWCLALHQSELLENWERLHTARSPVKVARLT